MRVPGSLRRSLAASALLATVVVPCERGGTRDASACGMAYNVTTPNQKLIAGEDTLPAIAIENVLLIFDAEQKTEQFVREVRFEKANTAFGFVVPTPSRPEVARVAKSPFESLKTALPYPANSGFGIGLGRMGSFGNGGGGLGAQGAGAAEQPPPVQVLAVTRVGKFEATVLAAHDADAFAEWLKKNGFDVSPAFHEWLAHYVRLEFFFTAFRYDAPPEKEKSAAAMTSETVRMTFHVPQPYYPYREPVEKHHASERMMALWFASTKKMLPVAGVTEKGDVTFVQPWRAGNAYTTKHDDLVKMLGSDLAALLPPGDKLQVQTFRDWKTNRDGFGDVLMVPVDPVKLDDAAVAERRPLLGLLDPALEPKR